MVSLMAFYKDIENFVYEADLAGRPGYENFGEAVTFINGDDAYLYLELNVVHNYRASITGWITSSSAATSP